jgi:hypothetical protein
MGASQQDIGGADNGEKPLPFGFLGDFDHYGKLAYVDADSLVQVKLLFIVVVVGRDGYIVCVSEIGQLF